MTLTRIVNWTLMTTLRICGGGTIGTALEFHKTWVGKDPSFPAAHLPSILDRFLQLFLGIGAACSLCLVRLPRVPRQCLGRYLLI